MATVREHFDKAFTHAYSADETLRIDGPNLSVEVPYRVHLEVDSHAIFGSVFLASEFEDRLLTIVHAIMTSPEHCVIIRHTRNIIMPAYPSPGLRIGVRNDPSDMTLEVGGDDGSPRITNKEAIFTRTLYLFCENELSQDFKEQAKLMARAASVFLGIRDATFCRGVDAVLKPKAFISHDSRDKDLIARPLAMKLDPFRCPVWYDEFALRVGDSLRESIEGGLKTCNYCILVLTPNFLTKGGWTKVEYDSIFTRELVEGRRVILPLWHEVTRDDVYQYSPILADRVAVKWAEGVDNVATKLMRAILDT